MKCNRRTGVWLSKVSHLLRSGDFSYVNIELPLCRMPRFEVFSELCQEPLRLPPTELVFASSRLLSRFAIFCLMSISICCSSSIISVAAYELQLPSGGLYRISKQTTVYAYQMDFPHVAISFQSNARGFIVRLASNVEYLELKSKMLQNNHIRY